MFPCSPLCDIPSYGGAWGGLFPLSVARLARLLHTTL